MPNSATAVGNAATVRHESVSGLYSSTVATGADEIMGPPPVSPSHAPPGAPNGDGDGRSARLGVMS